MQIQRDRDRLYGVLKRFEEQLQITLLEPKGGHHTLLMLLLHCPRLLLLEPKGGHALSSSRTHSASQAN